VAFESSARVDVKAGSFVADAASITVGAAGDNWLASCEEQGLERTTTDMYRQHLQLHIRPYLGREKLSRLSLPVIRAFQDRLRAEGRSAEMIKRATASLGSLISDAQERGLASHNPVRELSKRRKGKGKGDRRHKTRLKVGVDIPKDSEISAIIAAAKGRWRPLLVVAIFSGLRASELRGLRWSDVDLRKGEIHVRQRADRYRQIGQPKSWAGQRTVPIGAFVVNTLKEWKLVRAAKPDQLVFGNGAGNPEEHANIIRRGLVPTLIAAGVTAPVLDDKGKPTTDKQGRPALTAKYTGLHALRHFYASWCINRVEDGGLGLPPKMVQERMGHKSITMTMDRYGHLFPANDDREALAEAEGRLLAISAT
jgi:integrase